MYSNRCDLTSTLAADEVESLCLRQGLPLLLPSLPHGSCLPAFIHAPPMFLSPALIAHGLSTHPEPEGQGAGEPQAQPNVGGGGLPGPTLHPVLDPLRVDRHQVHLCISAVLQGFTPGFILSDQDQLIWRERCGWKLEF